MDAAPEPSVRAPGAVAVVLAVLVGGTLLGGAFAGDGSDVDGVLPVGGSAVVLLAAVLFSVAFGFVAAPRVGWAGGALVAFMLLLAAWTGATIWWSIAPDRSWDAFNKAAAFAAFLGLGVTLAAVGYRAAARLSATVLALVIGAVLTWALLAKSVPSLDPEGDRVARLREPVEYWNALALLADIGLALGLWLGASREHRVLVRIGGGLLVYVATLSLLLTLSRVGVAAAAVVVLLWLALSEGRRVEGMLLLAASAGPAALVGGWAFTRSALVEDVAERSDRVADGAVLGFLALAGAALVIAIVAVGSRFAFAEERRRKVGRMLLAIAAIGAAAVLAGVVVGVGTAISSDASCAEIENDPSRLGSLDLSNRFCWWNEALDVYAANAPQGAGSGTFEIARKRYRSDARNVSQPHSVPLQQLADGGAVALGLFIAVVLAACATCVSALRRLEGGERAAAVALVAAPAAYLVHALVDYDWDFLAVTAPIMVALGVLAGAGRVPGQRRARPVLGIGAFLLAAVLLVSFASPRLADRSVRESTRALDDGDLERARDRADWARFFNPLSIEPIFALAHIRESQGFRKSAEETYVDAVELQPENPETWDALGLFEYQVTPRRLCAAYRFLNEAYTLDPVGQQWSEGGPLDVARAAVNRGACEPR
ncbi:MAG: O-antigen ligase family protein [Actinobacteria bacterium]|nr:O-antigen ligase family protein [Actinomycetota bacterium]